MRRIILLLLITLFTISILDAAVIHPKKLHRHKNYWKHVSHRNNAWHTDADHVDVEPK